MRLAVKTVLAILVFYLIVIGGLVTWVQYEFSDVAASLVRNTARLIGNELAQAVSGIATERLARDRPSERKRLGELISNLTEESEIVDSFAVVDRSGKVVAADDYEPGHQLTPPEVLFAGKKKIELSSPHLIDGGSYHLFVPLTEGDEIVGYVRLGIRSQRIVRLYRRTRRHLLFIAVAALAGAALLGLVVHGHLTRRLQQLTRVLEGVSHGDVKKIPVLGDEFSKALAVASRVSRELSVAREERIQATRRLGALMKAMDVGVVVMRRDGSLEFASAAAREMLAAPSSDDPDTCWEPIRRLIFETLEERGQPGAAFHVETDVTHREECRRLRLEVYPLEEEDEGYLVLLKDRQMMEMLERELGLAIQMRNLGRFYATFAHDLRAPLHAMVMNLELLRQNLKKQAHGDAEAQQRQLRYVEVLQQEISRLDRQLRLLLSQSAAPSDERSRLDLRDVVRDLRDLLEPQARRQHVEVAARVPERPVVLEAQGDRLKQAILNVLINALEVMPEGGELSLDLERADGTAELVIQDTGPGLDPALQAEVFEMSFSTKNGGSGVGLFVTRSVVESHGGRIRISGRPGGGTAFHLSFPLSEKA